MGAWLRVHMLQGKEALDHGLGPCELVVVRGRRGGAPHTCVGEEGEDIIIIGNSIGLMTNWVGRNEVGVVIPPYTSPPFDQAIVRTIG